MPQEGPLAVTVHEGVQVAMLPRIAVLTRLVEFVPGRGDIPLLPVTQGQAQLANIQAILGQNALSLLLFGLLLLPLLGSLRPPRFPRSHFGLLLLPLLRCPRPPGLPSGL